MPFTLQDHFAGRRSGRAPGIYSVCSAHRWVIRAAAEQAAESRSLLLIEATSNQVNQFGGYTGMRPQAFRDFVFAEILAAGHSPTRLILGGDHLGPNPWRMLPAQDALSLAAAMVTEYVQAGFSKIHLDASMPCADDGNVLSDEIVAERVAYLCQAAEQARLTGEAPVYVIGTEVPTPGGATHALDRIQVTTADAAGHTLGVHKRIFAQHGLGEVWPRVIALVVQPGVEFGHDSVANYDPAQAAPLVQWLRDQPESIVFEAHSTDYQRPRAYRQLVQDGFAILKVGPALTFAMRETLYALGDIEQQLIEPAHQSSLAHIVEAIMLREPGEWLSHYPGDLATQRILRVYSYSDRIRYFWHHPEVVSAVDRLVANLESVTVPESMWSRYLPLQYANLRAGIISNTPTAMILDGIREVLRTYNLACVPQCSPLLSSMQHGKLTN